MMIFAITLRRGGRWLGTTALLLAGMAGLAGLSGCRDTAAQKQREEAAELTSLGEKFVKEKILAPGAAQFRNQFVGKGGASCGEVNAKDAFGNYIGFQRYISVARELTMLAQDVEPAEFEESWQQLCR